MRDQNPKPEAVNTVGVGDRMAVSSSGLSQSGISKGDFTNIGSKIINLNGFDLLKFEIQPGASVITNQETMSYMDGGLTTTATTGSTGFFGALFRGVAGASVLQNQVQNTTQRTLSMTISPLLQGSIVQVNIQPGESWRFADRSFLACTPNLGVSGNLNIFSNFRMLFVSENLTYVTVSASTSPGVVWVSAHGACETHTLEMGTPASSPFFINNGCFLGMLDTSNGLNYYKDYVRVGLPSSMFQSMFTQLGFVMKIQDTVPPIRPGPIRVIVLTQSLNPHNLEKFISRIAEAKVNEAMARRGGQVNVSELFGGKRRTLRNRSGR
jgi:uncharacterized protein (AIM24 family)